MIVVNDRQGRRNPWAQGAITVIKTETLLPQNVGDFTKNEYSAPRTIEKINPGGRFGTTS